MQQFRKVFDFYINSSIHVSFAVVALALVTGHGLNIPVDIALLAFLFFSTVTGYNFVKYVETAGLHHRSLAQSLKLIQIFSMICGVGMVTVASLLRWEVLLASAVFGVFTLFYATPFLTQNRSLRKISGIKIYIIAVVWSGVTVLLPVLENGISPNWDVWIVCAQRFLFVLALMVPFEIRDLNYDNELLKTLPQVVGVSLSKVIGILWIFLFVVLEFMRDTFTTSSLISHILIGAVLTNFIVFSRKRQTTYFASFWVEGVPLLWLAFSGYRLIF